MLDHYRTPADSLKLRAARFLIRNMKSQYTWRGDGLTFAGNGRSSYEVLAQQLGELTAEPGKANIGRLIRELNISGATQKLRLEADLTFIKASYLIANIDQAFEAWRGYPWSRGVSFHDFCNYILPYNVFNEPEEHWRKALRNRYSWIVDSLSNPRSLREVTNLLNRQITPAMSFSGAMVQVPAAFGFHELEQAGVGKCDHLVTYQGYVLRALGIPARVDYVPVWANKEVGHSWVSINDERGKLYAFDAMYAGPRKHYKRYDVIPQVRKLKQSKAPKVFRQTYRMQPLPQGVDSSALGPLPPIFNTPNQIDVTGQYHMPTRNVALRADPDFKGPFAYLAVFNSNRWRITARGRRNRQGRYAFRNLGAGVLYLPLGYKKEGRGPVSYPLIVKKKKGLRLLQPNPAQTRAVRIGRKYPLQPYVKESLRALIGGTFQGAGRRDFRDARNLFTIAAMPRPKTNTYPFYETGPYRYVRFRLPDGLCRVAEMRFTTTHQGHEEPVPLEGVPISSEAKGEEGPAHITDGDVLSYFVAAADSGGWVGVDLGKKKKVTGVRFYPPNDGNSVEKGDEYKLFYWDYGWQSHWPKRRAKGEELVFEDAPTNALFILRNLTKGKDERIFTYEDGKQVWW